jgi:hypothetical protein
MRNYVIIKGNLFRGYTGTAACTGLSIAEYASTIEECREKVDHIYDNESDLLIILDLKTGEEIQFHDEKKGKKK